MKQLLISFWKAHRAMILILAFAAVVCLFENGWSPMLITGFACGLLAIFLMAIPFSKKNPSPSLPEALMEEDKPESRKSLKKAKD